MKNRIIAIALVAAMLVSSAVPSFAADTTTKPTTTVATTTVAKSPAYAVSFKGKEMVITMNGVTIRKMNVKNADIRVAKSSKGGLSLIVTDDKGKSRNLTLGSAIDLTLNGTMGNVSVDANVSSKANIAVAEKSTVKELKTSSSATINVTGAKIAKTTATTNAKIVNTTPVVVAATTPVLTLTGKNLDITLNNKIIRKVNLANTDIKITKSKAGGISLIVKDSTGKWNNFTFGAELNMVLNGNFNNVTIDSKVADKTNISVAKTAKITNLAVYGDADVSCAGTVANINITNAKATLSATTDAKISKVTAENSANISGVATGVVNKPTTSSGGGGGSYRPSRPSTPSTPDTTPPVPETPVAKTVVLNSEAEITDKLNTTDSYNTVTINATFGNFDLSTFKIENVVVGTPMIARARMMAMFSPPFE